MFIIKRLNIEKLKHIINDLERNGIELIDIEDIKKIYNKYGDDAYYDPDYRCFTVTEKGKEYVEMGKRQKKEQRVRCYQY